jgi:serine/threonine protein kinase
MTKSSRPSDVPVPGTYLNRGVRTEIVIVDHEDYGRCVEKRLLGFCDVESERQALKQEAELQITRRSTGVVEVYGSSHSSLYRKYIKGPTLREVFALSENALSLNQPLPTPPSIIAQLCVTLSALHDGSTGMNQQPSLVHRDLTPGNVYLEATGQVLLSDFGLAYCPSDTLLNEDELLQGTPRFLAPELYRGEAPSLQSDVYQLALLFAWMCEPSLRKTPAADCGFDAKLERPPSCRAWHVDAAQVLKPYGLEFALDPEPLRRPTARQFLTVLAPELW